MEIKKNIAVTQAKYVTLCLHIRTTAFYWGKSKRGVRIEIFTPEHIFRISWRKFLW